MLPFLTTIAAPALTFILMLIVGLELRPEDFRRVALYPRVVVIVTLGQILLLPPMALLVVRLLEPPAELAVAMVFLAFSPGGAISNYYTSLAGRNVALSVTLTAISTLLSLISIPIAATIFLDFIGIGAASISMPKGTIALQLFLFVVLPIILGMVLGSMLSECVRRWGPILRIGSLVLVAALLAVSLWTVRDAFTASLTDIALITTLFTCGAMLVGYLIACAVPESDREVIVIETAVRNIPVALLLGNSVLPSTTYVGFLAGYFLMEVILMVPYALFVRNQRALK